MSRTVRAFLGIGSNVDAGRHLQLAVRELRRRYGALEISAVYENPAVGFDGPDFLNAVAALETDEGPATLCREIERIHELAGRRRGRDRYVSRPLDIDLLLYGDLVLSDGPVRVPRSDILRFAFVLRPLAELAPDLRHPVTGRTLAEHWEAFEAGDRLLRPVDLAL